MMLCPIFPGLLIVAFLLQREQLPPFYSCDDRAALFVCTQCLPAHTSGDNLSSTVCGRGYRLGKPSHFHRAGIMVLSMYAEITAFSSVVFLLSNCI